MKRSSKDILVGFEKKNGIKLDGRARRLPSFLLCCMLAKFLKMSSTFLEMEHILICVSLQIIKIIKANYTL